MPTQDIRQTCNRHEGDSHKQKTDLCVPLVFPPSTLFSDGRAGKAVEKLEDDFTGSFADCA